MVPTTIIFALALANLSVAQPPLLQAKPVLYQYECVNNNQSEVRVYGNEPQTCPQNTFCNKGYHVIQDEPAARPCIGVTDLCPYECIDRFTIKVNNVELKCGKYKHCNEQKTSCTTCLCDRTFTCRDDYTADISGDPIKCSIGQRCNKNYVHPCKPCINNAEYTANSTKYVVPACTSKLCRGAN